MSDTAQSQNDELMRLLSLQADQRLSDEEHAHLSEMLHGDSSARELYFEFAVLSAQLRREARRSAAAQLAPNLLAAGDNDGATGNAGVRSRKAVVDCLQSAIDWRRHKLRFGAFVLIVTLLLWAGFFLSVRLSWQPTDVARPDHSNQTIPTIVAEITRMHQVEWANAATAPYRRVHLLAGNRLELKSGLLEVTFRDGAVVFVEGPANFTVQTRGEGHLELGKLVARVPPQAVGFLIATPHARFEDLGTEFGVLVDQQGVTEVHVLDGTVRAQTIESTGRELQAAILHKDQAVRIDRRRELFTAVSAQPEIFAHAISTWRALHAKRTPLDLSNALAVASSQFDATRNASNAFDGSHSTDNSDRWVSDLLAPDLTPWVYVDLGSDLQLNSVLLDFQNQDRYVPQSYEILMRTDAQGPDDDPANWTRVALLTGATANTRIGSDHLFDFSTGTFRTLGTIGGRGTFSDSPAVGRYLMFHVIDLLEGGQNGISVLEIEVDAAPPGDLGGLQSDTIKTDE